MRLSIVVPVLGQHELAITAIDLLRENITEAGTEIIVVDNGGDLPALEVDHRVRVINPGKNLGVYPVFQEGMKWAGGDVVAFFHSDLMVVEKGFDKRIINAFEIHPKLGLVGFVGSNEIDAAGGRGGGTTSNFQGGTYYPSNADSDRNPRWVGSPAEAHGKRTRVGYEPAAVVDGCAMVLRRTAWEKIGYRENFPPHHFYDRLISTQMLEAGYKIFVIGIACDHISGQTVGGQAYVDFAELWSIANLHPHKWVGIPPHYAWDQTVYQEAERQWLSEYRDRKHLVPIRV